MRSRRNEGFTLIELLIVVAIIGIIAAIAVPGLMRARMAGNESSAIGSLRSINSAQATFSSSCANGLYAADLAGLAVPPAGTRNSFISPDLGTNGVAKSGYTVNVAGEAGAAAVPATAVAACNGTAVGNMVTSYWAQAVPTMVGTTGQRRFATDARGTVFQDPTANIANPIVMGGNVTAVQ